MGKGWWWENTWHHRNRESVLWLIVSPIPRGFCFWFFSLFTLVPAKSYTGQQVLRAELSLEKRLCGASSGRGFRLGFQLLQFRSIVCSLGRGSKKGEPCWLIVTVCSSSDFTHDVQHTEHPSVFLTRLRGPLHCDIWTLCDLHCYPSSIPVKPVQAHSSVLITMDNLCEQLFLSALHGSLALLMTEKGPCFNTCTFPTSFMIFCVLPFTFQGSWLFMIKVLDIFYYVITRLSDNENLYYVRACRKVD